MLLRPDWDLGKYLNVEVAQSWWEPWVVEEVDVASAIHLGWRRVLEWKKIQLLAHHCRALTEKLTPTSLVLRKYKGLCGINKNAQELSQSR